MESLDVSSISGVMSLPSVEYICLAVPEDFVAEPFCAAFQKISVSEKLMDKSGWGSIKILPSQIFVS